MSIKKNFVEIHSILVKASENGLKVTEVLDDLIPLMESKQRDSNHRVNDNGELEIFCYYHKEWECVAEVEYGKKANTVTGYNTMCKIGTNNWTRQQREYKANKAKLLDLVHEGTVAVEDLPSEFDKLEQAKEKIVPLQVSLDELAKKSAEAE